MSSIDEDLKRRGEVEDEFESEVLPENELSENPMPSSPFGNFDILSKLLELFNKPTGEGSIEEYMNHPLNFEQSKGMAQMIRGFTGFFGDLKKAVVDIAIGYFNYIKEKRSSHGDGDI